MAKKVVAGYRDASAKDGRNYAKVIKMVKSPKSGAYVFEEKVMNADEVDNFLKK